MAASDNFLTREQMLERYRVPVPEFKHPIAGVQNFMDRANDALVNWVTNPYKAKDDNSSLSYWGVGSLPANAARQAAETKSNRIPTEYVRMSDDELDLWRGNQGKQEQSAGTNPLQTLLSNYANRRSNMTGKVRDMQSDYKPLEAVKLQGYDNQELENALREKMGMVSDQTDFSPLMSLVDSWYGSNLSQTYQRPQDKLERQNQRDLQLLARINRLGREDVDVANQNKQLAYDNDRTNQRTDLALKNQLLQAMGQDQRANTRRDLTMLQLMGGSRKDKDGTINGYRPKDISIEVSKAFKQNSAIEPAINDMVDKTLALGSAKGKSLDLTKVRMNLMRDANARVPEIMEEKGVGPFEAMMQFTEEFNAMIQPELERLKRE